VQNVQNQNSGSIRNEKEQKEKDSGQPGKDDPSFEEKLRKLIQTPFTEPGSKMELIAIFEEEQLKKDKDEEE
jgi:hypothetical protein